jgi:hypothetical protein
MLPADRIDRSPDQAVPRENITGALGTATGKKNVRRMRIKS